MYFLLFLLIAMMIMLVVITTTNENSLINVVMIFLSIFVLIGGVYFMPKMNLIHKIITFIPTLLLIIFLGTSSIIFTFCNTSVSIHTTHENISLTKDEFKKSILITEKNKNIDSKKEIIIVSDNVVLKKSMFEDKELKKVKKIYFLSSLPSIDVDLYKQIEDRVTFSTDSVSCFTVEERFYIVFDNSKDFIGMSETDENEIYVYEFTYKKKMSKKNTNTINFKIVEWKDNNKVIFENAVIGNEYVENNIGNNLNDSNNKNATAIDLVDGKTYVITLKEANGIFSAKINEKKS